MVAAHRAEMKRELLAGTICKWTKPGAVMDPEVQVAVRPAIYGSFLQSGRCLKINTTECWVYHARESSDFKCSGKF